jgi:RNA polymerase sigma factor (sigma-70 family)
MLGDRVTCRPPRQQRAFVDLVTRVEDELRAYVRRCVGTGNEAHDIVQKTFLRAWGDSRFDPEHPEARAWLFKAAKRLIIDWLRSEDSNSISLSDLTAMPRDRKVRDPLADLIEEEMGRYLDAAMASLAEDHREVLERYYLRQEGTQFQIAGAMGLSVAAFNSRLNRARIELKRTILSIQKCNGWTGIGHDPK